MKRTNSTLTILFVMLGVIIQPAVGQNKQDEIFKTIEQELQSTDSISNKAKYLQYQFKHHIRVFDWQYYSSIVIFFIVIFIVCMGLFLSYKQFSLHQRIVTESIKLKQVSSELIKNDPAVQVSTLEIGKDGLKINTAVIGLIVLMISILFLFLYLKYVYPIQFIEPLK